MATPEESTQPVTNPPPPIQPKEPKESSQPSKEKDTKESIENKFEESSKYLPPPRSPQSGLRRVAPPLSELRLNRFIYLLFLILSLIAVFYTYRVIQYKSDVGGWWNLASGKTPASVHRQFVHKLKDDGKVETRLHLLAESLGVPPPASDELVGAIASAVREFVPPASLSSIAAKETGRAVRILVEYVPGKPMPGSRTGGAREGFGSKASAAAAGASEGAANFVDGVVNGMNSFVGMDDVPFDHEIDS